METQVLKKEAKVQNKSALFSRCQQNQ